MKRLLLSLAFVVAFGSQGHVLAAEMNFCTASKKGNYHFAGAEIAKQVQGEVKMILVNTKGSLDNLKKIADGTCDAGVVQSDAWTVYNAENSGEALSLERAGVLFKEYAHLVCNEEMGIKSVKDLDDNHTIFVGKLGSGSNTTWKGFVLQDKDRYGKIQTQPVSGVRALTKVIDGSEGQCFFYVASLNTGFMKKANTQGKDKLILANVDDWDFNDAKGPDGKEIYVFDEIEGAYGNLAFWDKETLTVQALVVVSVDWIDANEDAYETFLDGMLSALPTVHKRVGHD